MLKSDGFQSTAEIDARLAELEQEKKQLLALREQLQQPPSNTSDSPLYSPEQKIAIFRGLFRGRADIFANRWQNKQGRSGYSVACNNEWVQGICHKPRIKCQDCNHRQFTKLNDQIIYRHLAGQQVVGLYPLMHDNTCYFLAADFDKGQWQDEVKAMSKACQNFGIPHAIEISRSGNGAHLWIFFNEKVPAKEARLLGFGLLDKAMEFYPNLSFDSYDRLFPNQDILPEGEFGNLIALPLQKEARLSGNSSFVDNELNVIQDQWQHLANIESISHGRLTKLLTQISPNSALFKEQEVIENRPPWEMTAKAKPLLLESPPEKITITLANHVYFDLSEIPSALAARLRRLASFSNPVFFKTQALRFSTHGIPRFISCARIEQGYLAIPRGCLDEALELLTENQIEVQLNDQRERGTKLKSTKSLVKLRKNQQAAVRAMSKHDAGILHAPTAFGKTVTAIGMITKRKANTLILVHSRQLLDQWRERLKSFLPDTDVGIIGGGKKKPTGVVDIATYQSLINKKDNTVSEIVQDYGHVIVDECHHVSAPRFEMVLNEVRAKYVLGLTATPERQDGHQKIIFMAAGPIRHKVKSTTEDKFEQQVVVHQLYDAPPKQLINSEERPKISDAYRWIMENDERTQRIISDVLACIQQYKHPIVLTERREHAETINALLLDKEVDSVVLKGAMRASERKAVEEQLPTAQVVVATGKYVGEGFDLPRLDTLFLAMPIAWKGSLDQYAGRIHRESDGKDRVTIYDYVDCSLPMLQRMFNKREKSYKAMGYQISFNDEAPEQSQLSTEFLLASDKQGSKAPA
ncbi:DNA helicase [Solemya velum gill symbiont]|uniref:TOTE conflict system archaeo-eukaryotic primase domain-containing protein n=1 Tax=Solemya velum gill symbiont TaxID=2340 RepID=UPI0009964397|nr:DEAD/DEAH box helicase [Solemya velum gill symbiont]OOY37131.1 DNA helicase [Solemya velum gill symbiont]OOY46023.1 DNA helicase [Solemya velum gill symbiont]